MHHASHTRRGFSVVELLVVIAIIAMLVAILLPALSRSRKAAVSVQCQSNMRSMGQMLKAYEQSNGGWFYPVVLYPDGTPRGRGTALPPNERWPMYVYDVPTAPSPPPFDPAAYPGDDDIEHFPTAPYTPREIRCPADEDPADSHTYVLNGIVAARSLKAGNTDWGGQSSASVILAAEKYSTQRDYYFEAYKNFEQVIDPYRHTPALYSNYLFFDGHVAPLPPDQARAEMDPWENSTAAQ